MYNALYLIKDYDTDLYVYCTMYFYVRVHSYLLKNILLTVILDCVRLKWGRTVFAPIGPQLTPATPCFLVLQSIPGICMLQIVNPVLCTYYCLIPTHCVPLNWWAVLSKLPFLSEDWESECILPRCTTQRWQEDANPVLPEPQADALSWPQSSGAAGLRLLSSK